MAFSAQYNTNALLTLLNQSVTGGGPISITSVQTGSGFPAPSDKPENYTGLKNPVSTLTAITSPSKLSGITSINAAVLYQSTVRFQVSSADAPLTYQWNEYGIFAKVGSGTPVLICYVTTGAATGDTVTPSGTGVPLIKQNATIINYSLNATTTTSLTLVNTVDLHASTHLDNGTDPIPVATTARTGSLPKLSGDPNTALLGTGVWGAGFFPGFIAEFAGTVPPAGWLGCDGQAYSRTTYAALFSIIGITYGAGDGSTTFNVPDCRGRATLGAGQGTGLTNRALGSKGGEETHALSAVEMPTHTHAVSDPTHSHSVYDPTHTHQEQVTSVWAGTWPGGTPGADFYARATTSGPDSSANQFEAFVQFGASVVASATNVSIYAASTGISVANTGGNAPHNNVPPYVIFTKIIKT